MAAAIYSTTTQEGIDINSVFYLDTKSFPEYPAPSFVTGEYAWGTDGSEWIFSTASISIAAGNVVRFSEVPGSWSVALLGGATIASASVPFGDWVGVVGGSQGSMSVAAPSGTQTGSYFWVQLTGNCPNITCTATAVKNAQLYDSATTPGAVTSTAGGIGTTYQVNGVIVSQANGSVAGPNTAILSNPTIGLAT